MPIRYGLAAEALCGRLKVATAALCLAAGAAQAQDEVPFITTPDSVTLAMLEMAGVSATDRLIDLGSGDGRIVITAAKRFGARGLGVEIVPDLVARSRVHARNAGVAAQVDFRVQDLFETDLGSASVITMYLLPEVNLQLRPRLLALAAGTRIVSHDWGMGDWRPDQTRTLDVPDKAIGRDKRSSVHLWVVPARVQGRWCGSGAQIDIQQRFQSFSASLTVPGLAAPVAVFDGRVSANTLLAPDATNMPVARLQLDGGGLRLISAVGAAARFEGGRFTASSQGSCP